MDPLLNLLERPLPSLPASWRRQLRILAFAFAGFVTGVVIPWFPGGINDTPSGPIALGALLLVGWFLATRQAVRRSRDRARPFVVAMVSHAGFQIAIALDATGAPPVATLVVLVAACAAALRWRLEPAEQLLVGALALLLLLNITIFLGPSAWSLAAPAVVAVPLAFAASRSWLRRGPLYAAAGVAGVTTLYAVQDFLAFGTAAEVAVLGVATTAGVAALLLARWTPTPNPA